MKLRSEKTASSDCRFDLQVEYVGVVEGLIPLFNRGIYLTFAVIEAISTRKARKGVALILTN